MNTISNLKISSWISESNLNLYSLKSLRKKEKLPYGSSCKHGRSLHHYLYIKISIGPKFKDDNSPSVIFFFRPILLASDTTIYKLAKFLSKILQLYYSNNFSFIRESKELPKSLKEQDVDPEETCSEYINKKELNIFWENSCIILKDKTISLLELALNNCVFPFKEIFYQQLQKPAMGYPAYPVIAKVYKEYFQELAIHPECPKLSLGGKDMLMALLAYLKKNK